MLTGLLGMLLAASMGSPAPHAVRPGDVCLLLGRCSTEPVYCLVDATRCAARSAPVCFVDHCPERGPELVPRGRGSSR